jgi:N-acetylneuraminate epimerase
MIRSTILLSLIIMFFTVATYAQKRPGITMQWKIAAELPAQNGKAKAIGFAGPVAGMQAGRLMIGGGANFPDSMPWLGGKKKYYDDVYVYEEKGKEFVLITKTFKLPFAIAYAACCSTEQGVVVAGGENEKGISNKVFLLQWNKKAGTAIIKDLPDLPVAVTNAAAVAVGTKVYLAGGETLSGTSNQVLVLDLNDAIGGWKQLPSLPQSLSHTVLTVQNNSHGLAIYAAGGRMKNANGISDLYSSLFAFDLQKNEWITKKSLPYTLSAGTGAATGSGYILLFGGDKGDVFHKTEELIAAINKETNAEKREMLNKEKIYLQSTHPGFSSEVLLYDTIKDEWKTIDNIPFEAPVTTTAITRRNYVLIPGGEIKAGIRTPFVLQGKINITR